MTAKKITSIRVPLMQQVEFQIQGLRTLLTQVHFNFRLTSLVVFALCSHFLIACSGEDSTLAEVASVETGTLVEVEGEVPPSSSGGETSAVSGLVVTPPIELYLNGGFTEGEIQIQIQRGIADCMGERGWEYLVADSTTSGSATFAEEANYRRNYGYGIFFDEPDPTDGLVALNETYDINHVEYNKLDESAGNKYLHALVGSSKEGEPVDPNSCTAIATSEVMDGIPSGDPAYAEMTGKFINELEANAEYISAIEAWSSCMADRGYQFDNPDHARNSFFEESLDNRGDSNNRAAMQAEELKLATADIDCYEQHVIQVKTQVENQIITDMVDRGDLPPLSEPTTPN